MDETDGRFLRSVFAAELIFLAVPTLAALGVPLAVLAFAAFDGFVGMIYDLADPYRSVTTSQLVLTGILSVFVAATLIALWHFSTLSIAYLSGRNIRTARHRRKFWIGFWAAAIPMLLPLMLALSQLTSSDNLLFLFYFSGLPMLVPVLHLKIATSLDD